ncbi:AAA family ATPase [Rhizobium sp. BK176]|uniref:AAA family ATPase n=1 Tax=Rhizobium sp. BK176 TaxID=2587071 RepID=UPI002166F3D4|nr:AAA family ATPase [Rhizobium sp. BK176]MCS4089770.1 ATP-dependent Clp protease ATP-binding subunit ClpA [Rhizobium sp. BK176]
MLSSELEKYIAAASDYAKSYLGPATSLVHVLLAVLDDTELQRVLSTCGVNYLDLRQDAVEAIAERMAVAKQPSPGGPPDARSRSDGLSGLCIFALQAAQQKAAARGSTTAGVLDLIAAVLEVHDTGTFDFEARLVLIRAGLTGGNFAKARRLTDGLPPSERLPFQSFRFQEAEAVSKSFSQERREPEFGEPSGGRAGGGAAVPFCEDITELARQGKLDRSYGRQDILQELQIILGRRKKKSAVLIADPGVGKTSVVEELAYMIVEDRAGPKLDGATILSLNMGALVGGTKFRGDLEERVKDLVAVLSANPRLILFIDEIHVLGSPAHSASAASDLLKPALASGAIRCIGATTLSEYKRFFEVDGAMSRRFAPVTVTEPTRVQALEILSSVAPSYAEFHGVTYPDWAIELALDLSIRHMPERRLPDKAIELIDDIGSRASLSTEESVTRQLVTDCVSAKIGRKIGQADVAKAIASLPTDASVIARAALRNGMAAPGGESCVIAVIGPKEADKETPVKKAAEALGRGYEALDMAEFSDLPGASGLLGAPVGYIGHDKGGRLYDVVKRSPGGFLHLRNISQAHPAAIAIVEECLRNGYVEDKTGRTAGLGGVQVVVSLVSEPERASIGFSASRGESQMFGMAIVDDADTVVMIEPATDEATERTTKGFAALVEAAAAAGARMTVGEGVEEHVASLLRSSNNRHARTFSRLVRVPVLDYLVSANEDFTVESTEDGVRIAADEAA